MAEPGLHPPSLSDCSAFAEKVVVVCPRPLLTLRSRLQVWRVTKGEGTGQVTLSMAVIPRTCALGCSPSSEKPCGCREKPRGGNGAALQAGLEQTALGTSNLSYWWRPPATPGSQRIPTLLRPRTHTHLNSAVDMSRKSPCAGTLSPEQDVVWCLPSARGWGLKDTRLWGFILLERTFFLPVKTRPQPRC